MLGISAVVSTAYGFVKQLSLDVKRFLPDITIILGGNLGASAEILLRRAGIDFVVTGGEEIVAVKFLTRYSQTDKKGDFGDVPSLMYLDGEKLINLYEKLCPKILNGARIRQTIQCCLCVRGVDQRPHNNI